MKDADLKYLTFKTAVLLALASSKRRNEIHAWVANKVFNLGQWEKVAIIHALTVPVPIVLPGLR